MAGRWSDTEYLTRTVAVPVLGTSSEHEYVTVFRPRCPGCSEPDVPADSVATDVMTLSDMSPSELSMHVTSGSNGSANGSLTTTSFSPRTFPSSSLTVTSGRTLSGITSTWRDPSAGRPEGSTHLYVTPYVPTLDASTASPPGSAGAGGPELSWQRAPGSSYSEPTSISMRGGLTRRSTGLSVSSTMVISRSAEDGFPAASSHSYVAVWPPRTDVSTGDASPASDVPSTSSTHEAPGSPPE